MDTKGDNIQGYVQYSTDSKTSASSCWILRAQGSDMNTTCSVEPWQMSSGRSSCLPSGGTGPSAVLVVLGVLESRPDSWLSVLLEEEASSSCLRGA